MLGDVKSEVKDQTSEKGDLARVLARQYTALTVAVVWRSPLTGIALGMR